jgi:hypothetical protein
VEAEGITENGVDGAMAALPAPCIRIIRDFLVIRARPITLDIMVLPVAATVADMVGAIVGDP